MVLLMFVAAGRTEQRRGFTIWNVRVEPHFDFSATYDDNVFLDVANRKSDLYTLVKPGVRFSLGNEKRNLLTLDYTAEFQRFNNQTQADSENQYLDFKAKFSGRRFTLIAGHKLQEMTSGNPETSSRITSFINTSTLSADMKVSRKTSLGTSYKQDLYTYDSAAQISYRVHEIRAFANHRILSRSMVSGEIASGWIVSDGGLNDTTYQQFNLGVTLSPRARWSATAKLGFEHREVELNNNAVNSFIGSVNIARVINESTTVKLEARRSVNPSITQGGTTVTNDSVEVNLDRKIGRRLTANVVARYRRDSYDQTFAGVERTDNSFEGEVKLSYQFRKWGKMGISYKHLENHSSLPTVNYKQNVGTFQISVYY